MAGCAAARFEVAGDVFLAQRRARVRVGFRDAGAHGGEAFGAELFLGLPGAQCLADDFAVGGVAAFLDLGADEPGHVGGEGDAQAFDGGHGDDYNHHIPTNSFLLMPKT